MVERSDVTFVELTLDEKSAKWMPSQMESLLRALGPDTPAILILRHEIMAFGMLASMQAFADMLRATASSTRHIGAAFDHLKRAHCFARIRSAVTPLNIFVLGMTTLDAASSNVLVPALLPFPRLHHVSFNGCWIHCICTRKWLLCDCGS